MRLGRAIFVLPSLFTLTSVFLGFVAIASASAGQYYIASLCIVFAIVFDSVDGRVARLTRTQTNFGVQLDSLADVVSFGVAPATLAYQAYMKGQWSWGPLDAGLFFSFLYLAGGAVRLARYNVDASRKPGPVKQFTGLPIPGAAGLVAGLVLGLASEGLGANPTLMACLMVGLGLLMVSTVKYPKKVPAVRSLEFSLRVGVLLLVLVLVALSAPRFLMFALFAYYIGFGLIESALTTGYRVVRRRLSRRAGSIQG